MTNVDMSTLHLLEAKQEAILMYMKEFHKTPDDLRLLDYHRIGRGWYAVYCSADFPDTSVEVAYHADKEQIFVDLHKRVDRMTRLRKREWVFNPVTGEYNDKKDN